MQEHRYCVYIHLSPSNKAYIGITSMSPKDRWANGNGYFKKTKTGKYHQPAIVNAIKKYGWDNFEHIIFADNVSKEQAEQMEHWLIDLWATNNPHFGYNIRNGGGSVGTMSEESKRKMSLSHMGFSPTEETRRKISEANSGEKHHMYGKHHSQETRQKMSLSHKAIGRTKDDVAKAIEARLRAVLCIELQQDFKSISEASRQLNIPRTTINAALTGRLTHAGKHPVTGEDLHWIYKTV